MKKTWEGINALISHQKSNKAISRICYRRTTKNSNYP